MKKLIPILPFLLLAACQDVPSGNTPPQDTVATPSVPDTSLLTGKVFHAPKPSKGMAQARQQPPAFTLHHSSENGIFRLWLECTRDVAGNIGSIAVTLSAPEAAGSQFAAGTGSPDITDFVSDFDSSVSLADWNTGRPTVTWVNAQEVNTIFAAVMDAYFGGPIRVGGSHTQLIQSGNGAYREYRQGDRLELVSFRYPAAWGRIEVERPANSSGFFEHIGGDVGPYMGMNGVNVIQQ